MRRNIQKMTKIVEISGEIERKKHKKTKKKKKSFLKRRCVAAREKKWVL
jgi:hypothetical protein